MTPALLWASETSPPLLAEIRTHILEMSKTVLPKSAVGQACSHTPAIRKRQLDAAHRS
jgi:hypothetical protein